MFAIIGQKINDRLGENFNFKVANGALGSEVFSNTTFNDTTGWFSTPTPPRSVSATNNTLTFQSLDSSVDSALFADIALQTNSTYLIEYNSDSSFSTQILIGATPGESSIYSGAIESAGEVNKVITFNTGSMATGTKFFSLIANSSNPSFSTLKSISLRKLVSGTKVFPVIIPQGTTYPATTYEISNVSNFMSKGGSLNSCDVSINISCFADGYATTYNQAKAVVEALDLYQVTYNEDGQSYTAKFRFMNLDDEYYKQPEKFYKNLTFNCLIIKN